jgi:glutamyl-tRNA synthetase
VLPRKIKPFVDELFDSPNRSADDIPKTVPNNIVKQLVNGFLEGYDSNDDREKWFGKVKDLSEKHGFARDMKLYRKNPEDYKGHVGDVATVLRITLTGRANTPDLYDIIQAMRNKCVRNRLTKFSSE